MLTFKFICYICITIWSNSQ